MALKTLLHNFIIYYIKYVCQTQYDVKCLIKHTNGSILLHRQESELDVMFFNLKIIII